MQDERGGTALCMAASAGRLPLVPWWKRCPQETWGFYGDLTAGDDELT